MPHPSQPERPSTFDPHEAPTLRQRDPRSRPGPADLLVLVADNDPEARWGYCNTLYHLGHRVIGCADGGEAVDVALRRRPDVVLMATSVPGLDGVAVARTIKRHLRSTFVVAMTGRDPAYFDLTLDSGFDAFLCKPFNPYVLEEILEALGRRKDTEIVKRCSCGREYTRSGWKALRVVGTMGSVELRNCACGSSIALGDE